MTKEVDALYSLWVDFKAGKNDIWFFVNNEYTREMFSAEVDQILAKIQARIFAYQREARELMFYIRQLERKLIGFGNEIAHASSSFILFDLAVNRLLDFLKTEYPADFDFTMIAPASFKAKVMGSMELQVKQINQSHIIWKIEKQLARIIADYMELKGYVVRTFAQLDYYQLFIETFYTGTFDAEDTPSRDNLLSLLAYINFNSPQFISYCKRSIPKRRLSEPFENAAVYADRLRLIRYVTDQEIYAFNHSALPIKQQIISLIKAELHHGTTMYGFRSKPDEEHSQAPNRSLKFDLTLEEITFFFRLFIEIGVVVPHNLERFYEFIAAHVNTKNKTGLSKQNVKNSYTEAPATARKKVRDVLQKASDYLDQKNK